MILDEIVRSVHEYNKEKFKNKNKDYYIDRLEYEDDRSFYNSIKFYNKISIIAEIKKASPSKGIIRKDFDVLSIANEYEANDIQAISVLTEKKYFMGDEYYLQKVKKTSTKPILRKDFIIDPIQIYESKYLKADAILLIASILTKKELFEFVEIAHSLNMDCLVEVHSYDELKKVFSTNAKIIGINNRDLKNFNVNINRTYELIKEIPSKYVVISESGIKTKKDLDKLETKNIDGVLIGEGFMNKKDIGAQIKKIRGENDS